MHTKPIVVVLDGKARSFSTRRAAAEAFGVSESVLSVRLRKGQTPEEALAPRACTPFTVVVGGKTLSFSTQKAAAEAFGIKPDVLAKRLMRGQTPEEAIAPRKSTEIIVLVDGQEERFKTAKEAAINFGIKPSVFCQRVGRGWSAEQALELTPPPAKEANYNAIAVEVFKDGQMQRYASVDLAATAHGLKATVVRSRLRRGYTAQQALGLADPPQRRLPPNARRIKFSHGGQDFAFSSLSAAAKHFGLRPALVHKRRVVWRWSLEEALGLIPHQKNYVGNSKAMQFVHRGTRYRYTSIKEAAKAHGQHPGTVLNRYTGLGWSIQQALGLKPPPGHGKSCYGYIYLITHRKTGRQYVGQTILSIKERFEEHVRHSEDFDPNGPQLHAALRRHGRRAFTIEQIDETESFHDANKKEQKWIRHYRTLSPDGFNMTRGGGGTNLGRPITVSGERYPSIAEAARKYGVSPSKVAQRIRDHGYTPEQAVGLEPPPERSSAPVAVVVDVDGKSHHFDNIKAAANHFELDYGTVRARLRQSGWTVRQALEVDPPPEQSPPRGKPIVFVHMGKRYSYPSLREAERRHGVRQGLASIRIHKLKWTYAQALGLEERPRQRASRAKSVVFMHNGKRYRYKSVKEAAAAHGLKRATVQARLTVGGATYAEALGLEPMPAKCKRPDCQVAFSSKGTRYRYDSVSHAARCLGLKAGTVTSRLRAGYTIQQALNLAPPPKRG